MSLEFVPLNAFGPPSFRRAELNVPHGYPNHMPRHMGCAMNVFNSCGVLACSTAALWSGIKLKCIDAPCTDTGGDAARSTEGFNEEWAGYQVEVSRLNTGVSTS